MWNFNGTGHSRTATINVESVVLTILSKLRSVFLLMAFLSSSISFLISRRRSEFGPSGVAGLRRSLLLWLYPSSSWLVLDQFSSCWRSSLISWFCLVSSSTLAVSVWICRANAVESWSHSIWIRELMGTTLLNLSMNMSSPQIVSNWWWENPQ